MVWMQTLLQNVLQDKKVKLKQLIPIPIKSYVKSSLLQSSFIRKTVYKSLSFIDGPLTYAHNGLYTRHNSEFQQDARFKQAYEKSAAKTGFLHPAPWRVYVNCWAINRTKHLQGDLVECGVWNGATSLTAIEYSNFSGQNGKQFYLIDTFEGVSFDHLTDGEKKFLNNYKAKNIRYSGMHDIVTDTFKEYDAVNVVKGFVPDILHEIEFNNVSFLHIDMNCVHPEIEAIKFFWEKLVTGAVVILDDYGFSGHHLQKKAFDEFAAERDFEGLTLPTGQGLIIKS